MPAAKAVADRRPGNAPQPDAVIQHIAIAIAIGFGHAANVTDPWKNTKARIKPHTELDSWLDLEPKPEAEPQAQPKANAAAIANSNAESLPDSVRRADADTQSRNGGRREQRDAGGLQLHAEHAGHPEVLQRQLRHCLPNLVCNRRLQREVQHQR